MSIIQTIRDKAAWIIIGAIALALIAFIVQDAFQNRSSFSGETNTLGSVDGNDIDPVAFENRYKQAEAQYTAQGYPVNEGMREGIRQKLWDENLLDKLVQKRYNKLGIQVSDKELADILYGANPPADLKQQFTDEKTGLYNPTAAYTQIQALRKQKTKPEYRNFFGEYLPALVRNRQTEKYISLIANSAYVPKWMVEKMNADNSQQASISFVSVSYATISDSAVKVSDEDVKEYISARKEGFKIEKARGIEYVSFNAAPTREDSASAFSQVDALKEEFRTATDIPAFFARNTSETPYFDGFVLKSKMQMQNPDSIQALPEGAILGPYLDGNNYVLAKMIEKRTMPDSVKVRHILIKTADRGQPVMDDSTAKKRMDSIVNAIRGGFSFDSMVVKYSDDQGSKDKKGEYDFESIQFANISKEFAETIFYGQTGDKKTVKVDNPNYAGYHYIEVLGQKKFEPAFKVAYLSRPVIASDLTTTSAMGLAAQFAAENRNKKSFKESADKKKLNIFKAADIKPLSGTITGLGQSREMVRWIYDAEMGEVAETPYLIGDKYVVPILTQAYEDGLMPVDIARPQVEPLIRNQKKADQIIEKIKNASTLDAVSKTLNQGIQRADSVQFNSPFIPNVGQEMRVIGASFNKEFQQKMSPPIEGNGSVFVIKVDNIRAVPNPNFDSNQMRLQLLQQQQGALANPQLLLSILRKSADIKDNRSKFF